MPKIRIDVDSRYPSYDFQVVEEGEGSDEVVEITDEKLEWLQLRREQQNELESFLSDKDDEIRAREEEQHKLREARKAAVIAGLPELTFAESPAVVSARTRTYQVERWSRPVLAVVVIPPLTRAISKVPKKAALVEYCTR